MRIGPKELEEPMQALFLSLASLSLAFGMASLAVGEDQPAVAEKKSPKRELSAEEIAERVKDLAADEFAVREAAMKELRSAGKSAIGPLTEAAKSGNLEVTLRAVRILESFLTT